MAIVSSVIQFVDEDQAFEVRQVTDPRRCGVRYRAVFIRHIVMLWHGDLL